MTEYLNIWTLEERVEFNALESVKMKRYYVKSCDNERSRTIHDFTSNSQET